MNIPTPEEYLKQLEIEAAASFNDMVRLEQIGKDLIRFKQARARQDKQHKAG